MLMVVETARAAEVEFAFAALPNTNDRGAIDARLGETYRFTSDRCHIEVVLGFRPGFDRIVVAADSQAPRGGRALSTEEAGSAVIVDGMGRRIIVEGVALSDIVRGDIEVKWSA